LKFSEIDMAKWTELQPYLDTCLLPVTGMTGREAPWQATEALERLRDAMDGLERRYVGRIVTYPAFHYISKNGFAESLSAVCVNLKKTAGFRFVVLITADPTVALSSIPEGADLLLNGLHVHAGQAEQMIGELWQGNENVPDGE
jgi:23S rRNA (pseudouridine1915-N3)-methyltransferase